MSEATLKEFGDEYLLGNGSNIGFVFTFSELYRLKQKIEILQQRLS